MCCYAGWSRAQGVDTEDEAPTDDEHEALIERFKQAERAEQEK